MDRLFDRQPRRYRRVLVTNSSAETRDVDAQTIEPNALAATRRPLGLAWPPEVFSLTPRGERAVLTVGTDTLMRLSSNPFFAFVAERISVWLRPRDPAT
jgi:hypothetical protein